MTVEPNDLLLFARVVEAGSFSRAAERLGLPKSTVSRRVSELERRLGERLLQRSTRKLSVTEFGISVLDHARQVVEEVDGAMALALHRQAKPSGKLRISMPGDFANMRLSAMMTKFVQDHPAISLQVDVSPRRVDLIGESFDLAIRMGELPDDTQLAARRLAEMSIGLYAAPSYLDTHGDPASPQALEGMSALMILSRSGDPAPWTLTRGQGAAVERWSGVPAQRTVANSPDLLIRMARLGAGITAVQDHFATTYVQRGELRRVLPDWHLPPVACSAVFPGRRLMPAKTRVFLDTLAAALRDCDSAGAFAAVPAPRPGVTLPLDMEQGA
jgi:DNA-binding transcriptional LysR family regulator